MADVTTHGAFRNAVRSAANLYDVLARQTGPGSVCELPIGLRDGFGELGRLDMRVLYYQTLHGRPITGGFAPGASSGEAIADIDALSADTLPRSMGTEWTELIFLQVREGNTTAIVFALAVLAVFLALAAL